MKEPIKSHQYYVNSMNQKIHTIKDVSLPFIVANGAIIIMGYGNKPTNVHISLFTLQYEHPYAYLAFIIFFIIDIIAYISARAIQKDINKRERSKQYEFRTTTKGTKNKFKVNITKNTL